MNNEAEHPGKLESLRMRENPQANSLSKHVDQLERILDAIAPDSRRSHQRAKVAAIRHPENLPTIQPAKSA